MMDKQTKRMHEARKLARDNQAKEDVARIERDLRKAFMDGYNRGASGRDELARMLSNPISEMLLREAGRELGRMVAKKADEEGTPGAIAARCAEAVWAYVQKTGAPMEDIIKCEVYDRMETMGTVLRVHVPAMELSREVDRHMMYIHN